MMRFHKDGESQVRHALTMCQKHIEDDGGRILGLARPYGVSDWSIQGVKYGLSYRDKCIIVICVSFPIKCHVSQLGMHCMYASREGTGATARLRSIASAYGDRTHEYERR